MGKRINLNTLRVDQLNALLASQSVQVQGFKAAKIAKLIEIYGTNDVDPEELELGMSTESNRQTEVLAKAVEALMKTVQTLAADTKTTADMVTQLVQGSQQETTDNGENEGPNDTIRPGRGSLLDGNSDEIEQEEGLIRYNMATGSRQWSIKEIRGMLPEFDPLRKTLSSQQMIDKSQLLREAYGWNEQMLTVAVQQQLRGCAKIWIDSQRVFCSWAEFVDAFLKDFPSKQNSADYHRQLMKQRKKSNQTLCEFYYETLAIGRRGNVEDEAIVTYIIEGLNDYSLTRSLLARNIKTCHNLLGALENLSESSNSQTNAASASSTSKYSNNTNKQAVSEQKSEGIKCYHCKERGHIAAKCPIKQKLKCNKCHRMGHDQSSCYAKVNVSMIQPRDEQVSNVPPIFKTIQINNVKENGFVDTGSNYSLIEEDKIPEGVNLKPTAVMLKGFGGAGIETTGAFNASVNIDGENISAMIYVVPKGSLPCSLLLGRNILCRENRDIVICVDAIYSRPKIFNEENKVMTIQENQSRKFDIGDGLNKKQQAELDSVLRQFDMTFAEDISTLGRSKHARMEIEVTTKEPIIGKRYQIPFAQRGILSTILENLQRHDIIRPSSSNHAASEVLVKKSNGETRMCDDYRALNEVTVKKHFPIPIVEEQLSKLAGNKYFTILDMTAGYYQIPMDEGSKHFTAFATHEGIFEHNVMPFGLVNAPMQFQKMIIQNVISKLPSRVNVISYVDEIIIATPTIEKGMEVLKEVLIAISDEGLTLRPSKCSFLKEKVKFLGHVVSINGIRPGKEKTKCIETFPTPTNVHEVRQFLGLTGFFRKFVERYGHKIEPLTQLLKKKTPFVWGIQQNDAFCELKAALICDPVLALFDPGREHEVHTDASSVGISGILLQAENDEWKAVFYYSRQCTDAEKRYTSHELEVLAIVQSLERFRLYLLGAKFTVVTDCNAVVTTKAITPLPSRIARWWLKLQEFDFAMVHRAGRLMSHVDSMSRSPSLPPEQALTIADMIYAIADCEPEDWILSMQLQDTQIKPIVETLSNNVGENLHQLKTDYVIFKSRLYRKVNNEKKLVIPQAIRWRITHSNHDDAGHFGVEKTIERIRRNFWFPRMRKYVKQYIASCPECCLNKAKGGQAEGELHVYENQPVPFSTIHMDHLGPFIKSKRGNLHIIALVCAFSKYTILKAVRNTKTLPVLQMLKEVMSCFGQPRVIVTDRGTAFTSREFENYLLRFGITHRKVAVRTPRANGQVERVNRTILSSLRCSTTNPREWDELLPRLQWTINTQANATTKLRPNDLIFNFQLKDVSENRIIQALGDEPEAAQISYEPLKLMATENTNRAKLRWKKRFDETHKIPKCYEVGDLVVTDFVPGATGQSHKLDPLYKGPYMVTKVLDDGRYVVEDLPGTTRSNKRYVGIRVADHLKPWCPLNPSIDIGTEREIQFEDESSSSSGEAEL